MRCHSIQQRLTGSQEGPCLRVERKISGTSCQRIENTETRSEGAGSVLAMIICCAAVQTVQSERGKFDLNLDLGPDWGKRE
jgi:hypothetical protein